MNLASDEGHAMTMTRRWQFRILYHVYWHEYIQLFHLYEYIWSFSTSELLLFYISRVFKKNIMLWRWIALIRERRVCWFQNAKLAAAKQKKSMPPQQNNFILFYLYALFLEFISVESTPNLTRNHVHPALNKYLLTPTIVSLEARYMSFLWTVDWACTTAVYAIMNTTHTHSRTRWWFWIHCSFHIESTEIIIYLNMKIIESWS